MADRHEDGRHTSAGTQRGADGLSVLHQWNPCPLLHWHGIVLAHQPAFRDTDRGNAGHEPEVAGESAPARMGDALPIAQQKVGPHAYRAQRIQYWRDLAKGQQPGHIGERNRDPRDALIGEL